MCKYDGRTTVGIAGLGLIGGSLAKAFKRSGISVSGYDLDSRVLDAAALDGTLDCTGRENVLASDYVFIALYPDDIIDFVKNNLQSFRQGAVVVDCCGVKQYICDRLYPLADKNEFTFIGGHPMAGSEKSGFSASDEALFQDASFLLTPPAGTVVPEKLKRLLRAAGFSKIMIDTPAGHDRMIAYTSQLPHVLACAYVKNPAYKMHQGYSAGSLRDVSRVAHINPDLWSKLFIGNSSALCRELDRLIEDLKQLRGAIGSRDETALRELLKTARDIKDGVD